LNLKERLAARASLDAVVVRTPSYQVIEVLAAGGVECVMIDTEHAPFDDAQLDAMMAMARALGVDALVRVPAAEPIGIQRALDGGATGVVVPHVYAPVVAADVVRWCHYGDRGRGYSGSTRSAGWGMRSLAEVVAQAATSTVVVVPSTTSRPSPGPTGSTPCSSAPPTWLLAWAQRRPTTLRWWRPASASSRRRPGPGAAWSPTPRTPRKRSGAAPPGST